VITARLVEGDRARRGERAASRLRSIGGALVFAFFAALSPPPSSAAETHVVIIENMRFSPQELTVHRGDQVKWINKDLFPHTATATSAATASKPTFDSGSIAPGATWAFVASNAGEYAYKCSIHPTMPAKLIVLPAPPKSAQASAGPGAPVTHGKH
jgi:plastocyanin